MSDDVSLDKLQAMARANYNLDYPGALRVASGLNSDPNGVCRALWGKELNACYNELIGNGLISGGTGFLSSHALVLDGTAGCWCSTPDAIALDLLADIDMRIEFLGIAGGGVNQTLIGKWDSRTNQRSYKIHTVFGLVASHYSTTGINEIIDESTPAPLNTRYVRTTLDAVNGANHISEAFTGSEGMGLGTLLATETVAGNLAIFNSTAALGIGGMDGGTDQNYSGRITRAQLRSSIDGAIVANPDFRNLALGTTNFVDSAGLTWTLHGTARIG